MQKKAIKALLNWLLVVVKPKDKMKFLDIMTSVIFLFFEFITICGVLAMGVVFNKFYLSIFALVNIMFWRRNGGDHAPTSLHCTIASIAIFGMLFAACVFIDNSIIEYALSVALAFFFVDWQVIKR